MHQSVNQHANQPNFYQQQQSQQSVQNQRGRPFPQQQQTPVPHEPQFQSYDNRVQQVDQNNAQTSQTHSI